MTTTHDETVKALRKALGSETADLVLDYAAQCTTAETLTVEYEAALADVLHHAERLGYIRSGNIEYYLALHCPDIKKLLAHRKSMPDTIDGVNAPAEPTVYDVDYQINALVKRAEKQAREYAASYHCTDALRPAIFMSHFTGLINQSLTAITERAKEIVRNA